MYVSIYNIRSYIIYFTIFVIFLQYKKKNDYILIRSNTLKIKYPNIDSIRIFYIYNISILIISITVIVQIVFL